MITHFSTVRCRSRFALLVWFLVLLPLAQVSAQTTDKMVITHPPAGAVIQNGSTIYFSPGKLDVHEWRVTIGQTPEISGLFDSGVRNFATTPWELLLDGLAVSGESVTLRFWQRPRDGDWISTDTIFNTGAGGVAQAQVQKTSPAQATSSAKAEVVVPESVTLDLSQINVGENDSSTVVAEQIDEPPADVAVKPAATVAVNNGSTVSGLNAVHRHGQTFLTWVEVQGEAGYHVYRHTAPITGSNIGSAEKLTAKWGPLDSDTSVNKHAHGAVPTTYVISDLGQPLSDANGLFVNTPATNGAAYYAVTTIVGNRENIAVNTGENSLASPVSEVVADPKPVLTTSQNKGKGRLYTQYMDYANWNPTFNGYAYNYSLTLPAGYRKRTAYPLLLRPHAYGEELPIKKETEYNWQVIQIFPQDPGPRRGSIVNSWWFGYSADHNYLTDGLIPTSGKIANFTEQRVMQAIKDTIDDPEINVDTQLVHAFGHSMGASGSLALGMRYGNVFAGMYGSEPMTNYPSSPKFQNEWEKLWGTQSSNLPVTIGGPYTDLITRYEGTGVWDWMNHQQQLVDRRGDRMAYLMIAAGKADTIIDWPTQGAPMARVFNEASVGYSSRFVADAGHSWLGFTAVVKSLFGFGGDIDFPWRYPRDLSFPAIANASGSGPMSPGLTGTDDYNLDLEWATPNTRFAKSIVDKPQRYEVSIRSKSDSQTADITPKNTQQFVVSAGQQCSWKAVDSNKRKTVGSGIVVADEDRLVTIRDVVIARKKGTRVSIECP